MHITPARATDEQAVRRLLERAGLMTADIASASLAHFLVRRQQDEIAGVIGLDLAGPVAMIRSLAVAEPMRGRGTGRQLLAAIEALAARLGAKELYLLTSTAEKFFAAAGYRLIDRADAPDAIRQLPQFQSLCPASSSLMRKT